MLGCTRNLESLLSRGKQMAVATGTFLERKGTMVTVSVGERCENFHEDEPWRAQRHVILNGLLLVAAKENEKVFIRK